ncbi:hypothetical protein [Nonomuraea wenchangensis]|uniref:hypothetical protein n=1 Tax=Nonomuraea wenchangensis TaxID=568860 RepID=UPI00331834F2
MPLPMLIALLVFLALLALTALMVWSRRRSTTRLSQAVIDRAIRQGTAPELIYVVNLPGYRPAEQSVGVINDEGFGVSYFAPRGRQVEMRVDRGAYTGAGTFEPDGDGWYAEHEGRQEYVAVRAEHHVRLICSAGQVDRAVLKKAAEGARSAVGRRPPAPPSPSSLPPGPVKRGDMPRNGDGAPIQRRGPGG